MGASLGAWASRSSVGAVAGVDSSSFGWHAGTCFQSSLSRVWGMRVNTFSELSVFEYFLYLSHQS